MWARLPDGTRVPSNLDLGPAAFGPTGVSPGRHRGDRSDRTRATERRLQRNEAGLPSHIARHRAEATS